MAAECCIKLNKLDEAEDYVRQMPSIPGISDPNPLRQQIDLLRRKQLKAPRPPFILAGVGLVAVLWSLISLIRMNKR